MHIFNLKILGEAVSYAAEIDTTLEAVPTVILLAGMAKNSRDATLIAQNWIERTRSNMDMHLYFIHRLTNDSEINSATAELMEALSHQVDDYQGFLSRLNQSFVDTGDLRAAQHAASQSIS